MAASLGASQFKVNLWRDDKGIDMKWPPAWELVNWELSSAQEALKLEPKREAEEPPLLEAVARERLVKTQQIGKRLSGCCCDL
jgi:hypothetical protein